MDINKYKSLLKILVEWSIINKEYQISLFIYSSFNIGIPIRFVYKLPRQTTFFSLTSFINNSDNIKIDDIYLNKLLAMFVKSKYTKLEDWDNSYGYKFCA